MKSIFRLTILTSRKNFQIRMNVSNILHVTKIPCKIHKSISQCKNCWILLIVFKINHFRWWLLTYKCSGLSWEYFEYHSGFPKMFLDTSWIHEFFILFYSFYFLNSKLIFFAKVEKFLTWHWRMGTPKYLEKAKPWLKWDDSL